MYGDSFEKAVQNGEKKFGASVWLATTLTLENTHNPMNSEVGFGVPNVIGLECVNISDEAEQVHGELNLLFKQQCKEGIG